MHIRVIKIREDIKKSLRDKNWGKKLPLSAREVSEVVLELINEIGRIDRKLKSKKS